ncbi:hypothetical protein LJR230_001460 [Trinickia sp. LjRoot230]|uniref:hypothetical protein n=1 Tax=Trinickia sp. LjRoot230 TaxID=3342288 RepID=UPI003ECCB091
MVRNVGGAGSAGGEPIFGNSDEEGIPSSPLPSARRPDDRFQASTAARTGASFRAGADPDGLRKPSPGKTADVTDAGIEESYFADLEAAIAAVYPADGAYPDEVYQHPPVLRLRETFEDRPASPYNPLGLRFPRRLQAFPYLYNVRKISADGSKQGNERISEQTAVATHLDLAKQYNLAYVALLRAANGSPEALEQVKSTFNEEKIFGDARIDTARLNHGNEQRLSLAMLGHLSLDVLRSPDREVTTAARIQVLEILRNHFDVDLIAKAVTDKAENGLSLQRKDDVYDLVPQSLLTDPAQRDVSHTHLFFKNEQIKQLFVENLHNDRWTVDIHGCAVDLSRKYAQETVQILIGLLRLAHDRIPRPSVFRAVVGLTMLDERRKQAVFGAGASYRNGGVSSDTNADDAS